MNATDILPAAWTENMILVDAEYVDRVAFDLIVNFGRMIGRRIPAADLARWIECVALDGGMKPAAEGEASTTATTVVMVHDVKSPCLENFRPSAFEGEISGKAFSDNLGEFSFIAVSHEGLSTKAEMIADIAEMASMQKEVRRLMIVADADDPSAIDLLRNRLRNADDEKRITLFAMQPVAGGNFRQEILGYSLMNALGIRADEIK